MHMVSIAKNMGSSILNDKYDSIVIGSPKIMIFGLLFLIINVLGIGVLPASGQAPNWEYNVKNYGAVGDGVTDDSVAIKNCINAAIATKGTGTGPVRAEVLFPPGIYRVTQNDTLMTPSDGTDGGILGLIIRGFGPEVTQIVFAPTTTSTTNPFVGNLFSANKRARWFHIKDMTITSENNQANCFYFYHDGGGNNMNEGCIFERLVFAGDWQRVFGFDGGETANLNSEMTFRNIFGKCATYSDAFFRVGGISGIHNQQNQFVNYWFYNTAFVLNGGTLFKFGKGGAANFINGSWSAASPTAAAMTFISMPNENYNNNSAAQFRFANIRMEPKAANHRIIDCNLNMGSILFESCTDLCSIQNSGSFNFPLHRYTGGSPWGFGVHPTVRYVNCHLAGYHLYDGPASTRGRIIYDGCYFFRGVNGNMANATQDQGDTSVLRWSSGAARYTFRDCWNVNDVK
ncbi:MAG: glycosyl hydrolase family 28-related protein, partial [Phycisphaeraceae bacterium JB051]